MRGRGNLKQLVIEWCQHHPAYAGLAKSAWCIRLKDDDQPQPQAGQIHAMMLLELGYAKACVSLFNFNVKTPFVLLQQYVGLLGQQF